MSNLLLLTILLPLGGAGIICLLAFRGRVAVRQSALVTTLVTLALAGVLVVNYPSDGGDFAVSSLDWLGDASGVDVRFSVGLDGLSLWLFGLSALLMVTGVLVSWESIREGSAGFYALLLLLETGLLGVFSARDLVLFYVFFEFTLIPLFFLIGIWGSDQRRYAAIKFFLYTLAGSLLTFLGLLAIVLWNYQSHGVMTFSIPELTAGLGADGGDRPDAVWQVWVFLALFAGFAVKVPLFPFHTWLPLAHVEAPTAGSVVLAGVLLKVGTYGFVRLSLPMLPDAAAICMPYVLGLALIGILYGGLVALAQTDIKRLIAYSSVSHLGFCMLGLFAFNRLGLQGGTLQMINHGLSTGGLFACVGMIYERYHTREIRELTGLARRTPVLAFFFLLFALSSIGLPGLNGFVGEFLLLLGMFQRGFTAPPAAWAGWMQWIAVLSVLGVVLGAWYMLWLVERTVFAASKGSAGAGGQGTTGDHETVGDLACREIFALAPLAVFVLWIGLVPRVFLDPMRPALDRVAGTVERAYERQYPLRRPSVSAVTTAEGAVAGDPIAGDSVAGDGGGVVR